MSEIFDAILDRYEDLEGHETLKADGLDDAIIGIDDNSMRLIYSVTLIFKILTENDEMTQEDAMDHFNYNIAGAYVGPYTPIWCYDYF